MWSVVIRVQLDNRIVNCVSRIVFWILYIPSALKVELEEIVRNLGPALTAKNKHGIPRHCNRKVATSRRAFSDLDNLFPNPRLALLMKKATVTTTKKECIVFEALQEEVRWSTCRWVGRCHRSRQKSTAFPHERLLRGPIEELAFWATITLGF